MIVLGVNEVCCGCDLHAELSRVAVEGSLLRAEAQGLVPKHKHFSNCLPMFGKL